MLYCVFLNKSALMTQITSFKHLFWLQKFFALYFVCMRAMGVAQPQDYD